MDLKEQEVLGDRVGTNWYYSSKAVAMRTYLSKRHYQHVIDVGAGSGFFSKYLLAEGSAGLKLLCVRERPLIRFNKVAGLSLFSSAVKT